MIQNNENTSMCKSCGKCCTRMAGAVFPADIETIDYPTIKEMLQTNYCLDSWSGNPTKNKEHDDKLAYFIRPKHVGVSKILDESWGGTCSLLGENGCTLSFEKRPSQCKALQPKTIISGKCTLISEDFSKQSAAIAWLPYNNLLKQLHLELYNSDDLDTNIDEKLTNIFKEFFHEIQINK